MDEQRALMLVTNQNKQPYLDNDVFNQYSYSKWAISELIKYIDCNKTTPPIILVEEFAKKLDDYSCANQETSLIFSIGRDAVLNVLDALLAGKYKV